MNQSFVCQFPHFSQERIFDETEQLKNHRFSTFRCWWNSIDKCDSILQQALQNVRIYLSTHGIVHCKAASCVHRMFDRLCIPQELFDLRCSGRRGLEFGQKIQIERWFVSIWPCLTMNWIFEFIEILNFKKVYNLHSINNFRPSTSWRWHATSLGMSKTLKFRSLISGSKHSSHLQLSRSHMKSNSNFCLISKERRFAWGLIFHWNAKIILIRNG